MLVQPLKSLVLLGLICSLPFTAAETEGTPKTTDACVVPLTKLETELLEAGVEDDFARATFASLKPVGLSQQIGYLMVQRFIDDVGGDLKGYFVHGESKVGKTRLAVAFAHQVATDRKLSLIYITPSNVNRVWDDGAPESLAKFDVIIFDGLFNKAPTDPTGARMLSLFKAAVEMTNRSKDKKLLATSRLSLEDLVEKMYPVRSERRAFESLAFSIFQPMKMLAN